MTPEVDAEAAGAARSIERSIMDELAPVYRTTRAAGGLNYRCERREFVDWVAAQVRSRHGGIEGVRFLDVGCGTGEILELLRDAGARRLAGLDLSERMLRETCRNVPLAAGIRATVEQHPLAEGALDVVVAAFTVHHLAEPRSFFGMVRRILRPGGELFLLEYNREAWALEGWQRQALRVLTSPARFAVRRKNRGRRAREPEVALRFNPLHRLRTFAEFEAAAGACGLRLSAATHGMLSVWFNSDLCRESALDRRLMGVLRSCDRRLVPEGAGAFLWMHAVNGPALRPARAGS